MSEIKQPSSAAMQLAAQAWCAPSTSHKEMDVALATEFARILDKFLPASGLTNSEAERLYILAEEASEIIQAACKTLRHGYEATGPDGEKYDNRTQLETELGDFRSAQSRMWVAGDINESYVQQWSMVKDQSIYRYLRHQG